MKRSELPDGHSTEDFKCFGPVATKDGQFENTMLADLGCFTQEGKDSNKFYHASVCQSKINNKFYVYLEWGRTGNLPDFQFHECSSELEAKRLYEKQLHSKNDKRGEWYNHPVLGKILRAKTGKDCYLVRPQSVRSTGLPDARNISDIKPKIKTTTKKDLHPEVKSLLHDISVGVNEYTRSSLTTGNVPSIEAINEARQICSYAVKSKDEKEIIELTNLLYSRIPKVKNKGEDWILSKDNIKNWLDDLDAYESAVNSLDTECIETDLPFELEYIDKNNKLYMFLHKFIKQATRNKHYGYGDMKIRNLWKIHRKDFDRILTIQAGIGKIGDSPLHQIEREDLTKDEIERYNKSNTHFLFHGTRSVNVKGILTHTLRLPKNLTGVQINGAMFGPGAYFADDWKKSLGYTSSSGSYWAGGSGAIKNRKAFMFLADVVLGYTYTPKGCVNSLPNGYDSIYAKAGVSGVQNNEFIVFDENANNLRYLVEFEV